MAKSAGAVEYTDCISAGGRKAPHHDYLRYDTKQSDGEVPVMLELLEMRSTPLFPLPPGPLWSGVVASDRVLSVG